MYFPKFSSKDIHFAREYVKKHAGGPNTLCTDEMVEELCDNTQRLLDENVALREQLFQIEQEQDPERRWETILAAKLDRAIKRNINKDSLEIANSINNDIFIITIQRKFGQTPEQLRRTSDIRRLNAEKKNENLLKDNQQMMKRLTQLDKELRFAKLIKEATWDEIKTREDLELAIDAVNNLIKQHNQAVYRKQLGKLTGSMRESMQEAWYRTMDATHNLGEIKKELAALKLKLNQNKVSKSKFSKYRKRRHDRKMVARRCTFLKHS